MLRQTVPLDRLSGQGPVVQLPGMEAGAQVVEGMLQGAPEHVVPREQMLADPRPCVAFPKHPILVKKPHRTGSHKQVEERQDKHRADQPQRVAGGQCVQYIEHDVLVFDLLGEMPLEQ